MRVLYVMLVVSAAVSSVAVAGQAVTYPQAMACSNDLGEANVNELKSKGGGVEPTLDFVEFKVLQDNVDVTGWRICASDQPGSIECFDIGVGDGTWYTVDQTAGLPDDSQAVYDANTWVTYDFKKLKAEEGEVILLDEFGNVMDYIRWSNQAGICTSSDFSWDVPDSCGTCFDQRDPNQKDFAREPDGTGDWGNNGDAPTEGASNDPAPPPADHFAIVHDGAAVNCQAEPVTIVAHDAAHAVVTGYGSSIALATSTANGDWTGIAAGNGTLTNNGNGGASYQFVSGDNGQVTLLLRDTFIETLNINVSDGVAVEAVAEDPDLAFARSGFAFRVNGAPGVLPEQLAGKPSDTGFNASTLELEAINTNDDTGACEAMLTGTVGISFAVECTDPASCAADAMQVNGVTVPGNPAGGVANYGIVSLDFGDATDTTAPLVVNYADAGAVALHALLDPGFISAENLAGSTAFTVRPFGFELVVEGGTVTFANPAATTATGSVFTEAGEDFTVDVRAVAWQAADDADNDGIPDGFADTDPATRADLSDNAATPNFGNEVVAADVDLSGLLFAPTAGVDPGLSGTTTVSGFVAGAASSQPVRFDEVGIFEIFAAVAGNSYLGGGDVRGASGHVGRVVPAFFEVTVPAHGCADAGGFTYSAQDIGEVAITAYAASGIGVITENYDGTLGFAKEVALSETTGAPGTLAGTPVSAGLFGAGTVSLSTVNFTFNDAQTAATTIALRATDTDGVTSSGATEEGSNIRSGRFRVGDGSAPTIGDGNVPLALETWQEVSPGVFEWATHTDDATCTVPVTGDFGLSNHTGNLQSGETAITGLSWSAGSGTLTLSAPGAGNDGSVDVTGAMPVWLQFDWNGTGTQDPVGTMQFFEIFQTEEGFIDRHEVVGN